jgi:hypothetical protein
MITSVLITALITLSPPVTYKEIKEEAIYNCHHRNWKKVDKKVVEQLIQIEKQFFEMYDIPEELRGMLLIAACNESGYNPNARGDWTITKSGKKKAKAVGILQFWPWAAKKYGFDRRDLELSARHWMLHVVNQRKKIDRRRWCRRHSNVRKWVVAWVQTTRGRVNKANRFRCFQTPSHYKYLKRWHRLIRKLR